MIKRKAALTSLILCLFFVFCSCNDITEEIIGEFSKYDGDNNVVLVIDSKGFYFNNRTIYLDKLNLDGEPDGGYILTDDKLYFSFSRENGLFDFSFLVYECDLLGNNVNLIYQNDSYKTHTWSKAKGTKIYLEYYTNTVFDANSKRIDCFDVVTGIYTNVGNGKEDTLSDFVVKTQDKYKYEIINDSFEVEDLSENRKYRIDEDVLRKSDSGRSLLKFEYSLQRCDFFNEDIFLTYSIASHSFSGNPIFVIYSYNAECEEVSFKSLVMPYDYTPISIYYIA